MSEIPEHLLRRSRSAKASKGGGDAGDSTPEASSNAPAPAAKAPAAAAAAVPANLPNLDPPPKPAKPEPAYVVASKKRRRVPVWALPVVAALPLWAFFYPGTMQQPPKEDPLASEGAALFSQKGCAGCHGATGGGGTGYQLSDGSVLQTFKNPIDQMVHVARGSQAIQGQEYGDVRKDGTRRVSGAKGTGQMPAQEKQMTLLELQLVVLHERAVLSGEDQTTDAYKAWETELRAEIAAKNATPIDLKFLLDCADPKVTPGATGAGSPDPKGKPCPGPAASGSEAAAPAKG